MSAAPSHAPEHHPEAAAKAAPQANNTMHFNHGGVLGITESIGRLIKGVTYDAAQETWGTGAAANNDKHHKPEDKAHGADHPKADHPEEGKGHGTAATLATAAGAAHALISAHDEDKDMGDKVIDGIAKMGKYGTAFPLMATALKWTKEKLFPTIHEIPTDDQHVGDQILHKLKKDKKAAKKGKLALDHHALEGFYKGLDVANTERTFKMFTNEDRFNNAVKRPAGKEEIKKEVANLLDISGETDRAEVEKTLKMMAEFLGGHFTKTELKDAAGVVKKDSKGNKLYKHEFELHAGHHIDDRVKKQFEVFTKILSNAATWLTEDSLTKIYDTEVKEDEYDMDYKHIGDRILKLKDKTLVTFLKRIKKDGIDDIENEVGDLLRKDTIEAELKHNPDDLRAQISNLFNVGTGVTVAKLKERKDQMLKRLKYEEVDDPASTTTPKAKIKKVNSGDATLDAIGTQFVLEILEPATRELTDSVLKELYPLAEDAKKKFEWTDEKYKKFGTTIFNETNDNNLAELLGKVSGDKLKKTFNLLFSPLNPGFLKTSEGKKRTREQLANLLGLETPFTRADLLREVDMIKRSLSTTPAWAAGTKQEKNFNILNGLLDGLVSAGDAAATPPIVAGPFATDQALSQLFEETLVLSPEEFVNTFRELDDHEPAQIAAYIRGYKSSTFRAHFDFLFDSVELVRVIESGTIDEKNQARKEIRRFVGLSGDAKVRKVFLDTILGDFEKTIKKSGLANDDGNVKVLRRDLREIKEKVSEDNLKKLFEAESPKKVDVLYDSFGLQFSTLTREEIPAYLRAFNEITFIAKFQTIHNAKVLDDYLTLNKDAVKAEMKTLFNVNGPISEDFVEKFINTIKQRFASSISREDAPYLRIFSESLDGVKTALTRTRLDKIFA